MTLGDTSIRTVATGLVLSHAKPLIVPSSPNSGWKQRTEDLNAWTRARSSYSWLRHVLALRRLSQEA